MRLALVLVTDSLGLGLELAMACRIGLPVVSGQTSAAAEVVRAYCSRMHSNRCGPVVEEARSDCYPASVLLVRVLRVYFDSASAQLRHMCENIGVGTHAGSASGLYPPRLYAILFRPP